MKPVSDFTFYWYAAHQFVNASNPYTSMPGREYALEQVGIEVVERIPCEVDPSPDAEDYLKTKKEKLGH